MVESTYEKYVKTIPEQLVKKPDEWNFKRIPDYVDMLEHVSPSQGAAYLNIIKDRLNSFWMTHFALIIRVFEENDRFGKPVQTNFELFNTSPSNLRYLLHTLLVFHHAQTCGLKEIDFVEIGGGYGGLALFIHRLAGAAGIRVKSYTIFDLEEPRKLQKAYLEAHHIDVNTYGIDDFVLNKGSFLISNYAFSEIGMDLQREYTKKVIDPYTPYGFLVWNNIDTYVFTDALITAETEYPLTGPKNKYVRFKPKSKKGI